MNLNLFFLAVFLFCSKSSSFRQSILSKSHQIPSFRLSATASSSINLYGSPQSRSPLVNWYLYEKNIPFSQKPARPSNHPFGQVPFLTDDSGKVEVFESGAILLYLADAYGGYNSPTDRASYTKWVVWANSELDYLCFGKSMSGTKLDKDGVKSLDVLEKILSANDYLVDNTFSVADVAVGSYLNYVPIFFGSASPSSSRPNIVKYMQRCAERPAFAKAFGDDHASLVIAKSKAWIQQRDKKSPGGNFFKF